MEAEEVKVTVRLIQSTDIDAVLKLAGALITREEMASVNPGNGSSLCFVAEDKGRVVGFNLSHLLYVGIPLSKICVIQGIVVDDEYRRLGIGEKLIEAIMEHCVQCRIDTVRTLVEESDERLQQFVEYLGFRRSPVANYDRFL